MKKLKIKCDIEVYYNNIKNKKYAKRVIQDIRLYVKYTIKDRCSFIPIWDADEEGEEYQGSTSGIKVKIK